MIRINTLLTILLMFALSSCGAIEGIFKAGMYWGIFLVVGFIALILYIVMRAKK